MYAAALSDAAPVPAWAAELAPGKAQLAAGGGVLPIELSGGLFRAIHDWLPFTWAVRALRASLFGAFDNDWLRATAIVGAVGLSALLLSAFVGRWKSVTGAEQQPPIDV